jgi:hypothetical protein
LANLQPALNVRCAGWGAAQVVRLLEASPEVRTLDITGGAPELHSEFRRLVAAARALGVDVIDRCNLTVLSEDHQHDLAQFLADHQVRALQTLTRYTLTPTRTTGSLTVLSEGQQHHL